MFNNLIKIIHNNNNSFNKSIYKKSIISTFLVTFIFSTIMSTSKSVDINIKGETIINTNANEYDAIYPGTSINNISI